MIEILLLLIGWQSQYLLLLNLGNFGWYVWFGTTVRFLQEQHVGFSGNLTGVMWVLGHFCPRYTNIVQITVSIDQN